VDHYFLPLSDGRKSSVLIILIRGLSFLCDSPLVTSLVAAATHLRHGGLSLFTS